MQKQTGGEKTTEEAVDSFSKSLDALYVKYDLDAVLVSCLVSFYAQLEVCGHPDVLIRQLAEDLATASDRAADHGDDAFPLQTLHDIFLRHHTTICDYNHQVLEQMKDEFNLKVAPDGLGVDVSSYYDSPVQIPVDRCEDFRSYLVSLNKLDDKHVTGLISLTIQLTTHGLSNDLLQRLKSNNDCDPSGPRGDEASPLESLYWQLWQRNNMMSGENGKILAKLQYAITTPATDRMPLEGEARVNASPSDSISSLSESIPFPSADIPDAADEGRSNHGITSETICASPEDDGSKTISHSTVRNHTTSNSATIGHRTANNDTAASPSNSASSGTWPTVNNYGASDSPLGDSSSSARSSDVADEASSITNQSIVATTDVTLASSGKPSQADGGNIAPHRLVNSTATALGKDAPGDAGITYQSGTSQLHINPPLPDNASTTATTQWNPFDLFCCCTGQGSGDDDSGDVAWQVPRFRTFWLSSSLPS